MGGGGGVAPVPLQLATAPLGKAPFDDVAVTVQNHVPVVLDFVLDPRLAEMGYGKSVILALLLSNVYPKYPPLAK